MLKLRSIVLAAILGTLLFTATPVYAGLPGAVLGEKGFSEQAQNAADAAFNAVSALATHGESAVGASGPLSEIVLNSGSLICNSWIIMLRLKVQELHMAAARMDAGDDYNRTIDAAQKIARLADIVERECTKVKLIGDGGGGGVTASGGGGTGTTSGGESSSGGGTTPPDTGAHPRPGETVADEICRRKCVSEEIAMMEAEREEQRSADIARKKRAAADAMQSSLDSAKTMLQQMRSELSNLRKQGAPRITGTPTQAQEREMTQYNNRFNALNRDIPETQRQIERLERDTRQAKSDADTWDRIARDDAAKAEAARQAYYDCLKRCKSAAESAGEHTTLVIPERYRAVGKSTSSSKGKPRVKLESARTTTGTNPFDAKGVMDGKRTEKTEAVPQPQPAVQVTPSVKAEPRKEPKPEPVKTEAKPVAVTPPVKVAAVPLQLSVAGNFSFAHTVGGSPCPTQAGTARITSNHPGNALSVSNVKVSGAVAPKLSVKSGGDGTATPSLNAEFNCSSPANGTFTGTVSATVTDKVTGESQTVSVPASGSVKGSMY